MSLIKEFRDVQKTVNDLKQAAKHNEEVGRGVVNNTTAGLYKSTVNGSVIFGCTVYSTLNNMLKAYVTNTLKLTAGAGSPPFPVKSGINRIPLQAFLVECAGVYASPWLDADFKWIPNGAQTAKAYYALSRVGSAYAVVCQFPASGGGGGGGGGVPASWSEAETEVVTGVEFAESGAGTLVLNVTTTTLHYVDSGAN